MKLSDKLIELRKEKNWSQEDFAEKLDVSRQAISRWENGTALPDAQNILRISKLFNVSADYLLNDEYENGTNIDAVCEGIMSSIARTLANGHTISFEENPFADFNWDNKITVSDAAAIARETLLRYTPSSTRQLRS